MIMTMMNGKMRMITRRLRVMIIVTIMMMMMKTMRICTATSSVVNIIAVSQSQHYLVF